MWFLRRSRLEDRRIDSTAASCHGPLSAFMLCLQKQWRKRSLQKIFPSETWCYRAFVRFMIYLTSLPKIVFLKKSCFRVRKTVPAQIRLESYKRIPMQCSSKFDLFLKILSSLSHRSLFSICNKSATPKRGH
ncbi:hypothetical protein L596_025933 [Steinernema carpocapsae]|uniref:Uncharacterized protein n=1 Tax=Steinernema carpocapsae TaxID=34508 RepID=A0A4U5M9I4_STECR|nr:hypothetical protein L596_025933 [Steinernema carpocapsae]